MMCIYRETIFYVISETHTKLNIKSTILNFLKVLYTFFMSILLFIQFIYIYSEIEQQWQRVDFIKKKKKIVRNRQNVNLFYNIKNRDYPYLLLLFLNIIISLISYLFFFSRSCFSVYLPRKTGHKKLHLCTNKHHFIINAFVYSTYRL